jgi:LPS sulfotransferase NodH
MSQFSAISDWEDLSEVFAGKVLFLRREDTIKQAISLYIAFESDQWVSSGKGGAKKVEDIQYDYAKIDGLINRINYFNSSIERVLKVMGGDYYNLTYERYLADPGEAISNIAEFFDLKKRRVFRSSNREYRPQSREKNRLFYERYVAEFRDNLSKFCFSPPRYVYFC